MQVEALPPPSSNVRRKGNDAAPGFKRSCARYGSSPRTLAIAPRCATNSARLSLYRAVPGPVKPLESQLLLSTTSWYRRQTALTEHSSLREISIVGILSAGVAPKRPSPYR